jgi:hypothetical protein
VQRRNNAQRFAKREPHAVAISPKLVGEDDRVTEFVATATRVRDVAFVSSATCRSKRHRVAVGVVAARVVVGVAGVMRVRQWRWHRAAVDVVVVDDVAVTEGVEVTAVGVIAARSRIRSAEWSSGSRSSRA